MMDTTNQMKRHSYFFLWARNETFEAGFGDEAEWARTIPPIDKCSEETFFNEYVWCVLNAGMKEQVARKTFERFCENKDLNTIGHIGKRKAISEAITKYKSWFNEVKSRKDKLKFLESLPWIGPITKYHLARNIGIDCVKPDRHLIRLSEEYGFKTPLDLCIDIQNDFPDEKLGSIDVILWRYCNLTGKYSVTP